MFSQKDVFKSLILVPIKVALFENNVVADVVKMKWDSTGYMVDYH